MFRRVLLAFSGEQLRGGRQGGLSSENTNQIVDHIRTLLSEETEVFVSIGGDYVRRSYRGGAVTSGSAGEIAELTSVIDTIAFADTLRQQKLRLAVMSSVGCSNVTAEPFTRHRAIMSARQKNIVLIAGGVGLQSMTDDMASVSLALELNCDAILKMTAKEGVTKHLTPTDPDDTSLFGSPAQTLARSRQKTIVVFSRHGSVATALSSPEKAAQKKAVASEKQASPKVPETPVEKPTNSAKEEKTPEVAPKLQITHEDKKTEATSTKVPVAEQPATTAKQKEQPKEPTPVIHQIHRAKGTGESYLSGGDGVKVYLVNQDGPDDERLASLQRAVEDTVTDNTEVIKTAAREPKGESLIELYDLRQLPAVLVALSDGQIYQSWSYFLPESDELMYALGRAGVRLRGDQ